MTQVILIESNKTMNDLISVNLTTYLGVDLIHRKNAQDALSLLAILPNIDLIITCSKVGNEDTANVINRYLIKNEMETSLIVMGSDVETSTKNTISIPNEKDWENVVHSSAKVLGINEEVLAQKALPDYIPVPIRYFLNLESVNCDVFIRIKKTPLTYQYLKRIHNGDAFSRESIERYIEQGLEFFYVSKGTHKDFAIYLSNRLVDRMDSIHLDELQRIDVMGESYDIAIKQILKLGFNSETVQLTDTIIENMVKSFKKSPEMSHLLHKVINSKTGILYQRSHMISVVASEIVKNLKMDDPEQLVYKKIAFAAFFHDIILADHEEFTKINSFEELEKAHLSEKKWDLVFNHANEASLLIKSYPEAPIGADEIIRHHHGAFTGKGFSNSIEKLPDLSKVFIVAHHFVMELIRFKENGGEPRPVTEELFKRYPSPDAAVIIKALERTLRKKK